MSIFSRSLFFGAVGTLCFSAQANLTGYVKTPAGIGVEGITVAQVSTNYSASTDANGFFTIDSGISGLQSSATKAFSFGVSKNNLNISLSRSTKVDVSVFDLKGKKVETAFSGNLSKGSYEFSPFSSNIKEGVYFVHASAGGESKTFEMKNFGSTGISLKSKKTVLALESGASDSLSLSMEGTFIGKSAIYVTSGDVGTIFISRKTFSGVITKNGNTLSSLALSLSSSDGLFEELNAAYDEANSTYEATSAWHLYVSWRSWTASLSAVLGTGATTSATATISDYDQTATLSLTLSSGASSSSAYVSSSSSSVKSSSSVAEITMDDMESEPDSIKKLVEWVWDYRLASGMQDQVENYKNLIFYPIIANGGYLNYCVRWQSTIKLTQIYREKIANMLRRMINAWTDKLTNFEGWPYDTVYVNIVGWAVLNDSIIVDKQSNETVYTAYQETDETFPDISLPRCPDACARPLMYANPNYSSCPNYSSANDTHFDLSLWGTAGFGADYGGYAGAGGDWGQRVNDQVGVIDQLDAAFPQIAGHETGHGFGLPDYYEDYQIPDDNYSAITGTYTNYVGDWGHIPLMLMRAGSASTIQTADYWSLRMIWHHIKGNMGY